MLKKPPKKLSSAPVFRSRRTQKPPSFKGQSTFLPRQMKKSLQLASVSTALGFGDQNLSWLHKVGVKRSIYALAS